MRKVITFSDLLTSQYDDLTTSEKTHFLNRLSVSGNRMNHLIDGLLVFANVVKSNDILEKTCLTELTEEILEDCKLWLKENNAKVQVKDLPKLLIYKNQIRQIIYHLIINAVTYKKEDQPCHITISSHNNTLVGHEECVICIADDGIGIAPEYQAQIFKPFKRLHASDKIEGTGLGLAICQRAIEKHGGKIWVESQAGHGATFKFSFPLKNNL